MRRVAPSVIAREQLQALLGGGGDRETNIVSMLVQLVTRLVVQELVEGEQADFLGSRGRCERRSDDQAGSRNGYERGRLRSAEGFVDVGVPQVRGAGEPFRSSPMSFLEGGNSIGSFVGLVPSKHSSGASRVQGSITKTGNTHARRLLVEAAWHHRAPYRPGKTMQAVTPCDQMLVDSAHRPVVG
jgi:hypothetical protein